MSLKDNFNQAVKELLRKDAQGGDDAAKESKKKSELDRYLDPVPTPAPVQEKAADIPETDSKATEEAAEEAAPDFASYSESAFGSSNTYNAQNNYNSSSPYIKPEQNVSQFGTQHSETRSPSESGSSVSDSQASSPFSQFSQFARQSGAASRGEEARASSFGTTSSFGGGSVPPKTPRSTPSYRSEPNTPYYETEETTIISRNTIIDGNIRSFANLNIDGSVKGDVRITKNINVTGKVVGDIECNSSVMAGASMQGNISSKGQVQIDRDSILLGDISAQYLDLNGKVKGNVDIGGKAEFKTDAVILGNITASTITVLDGATIQGYVNTTFLQESSSSIFPEAIALSE